MEDRNAAVPHDTEDKQWWLQHGENLENRFVSLVRDKLHIDAQVNPEKARDPTVPDLIVAGALADLKTQNTPFFMAGRYGIEPRFAVTFNRKDYERYKALYPDIIIYFWIDWTQTEWKGNKVDYLGGIFRLPFQAIAGMIESGAREHRYIHRQRPGDRNAKSSFVLNIRSFEELFMSETRDPAK